MNADRCESPGNEPKGRRVAQRSRKADLVERAIRNFEERLEAQEIKPTVADLIRLLQFQQEFESEEEGQEIKVTWVEPEGSEFAE